MKRSFIVTCVTFALLAAACGGHDDKSASKDSSSTTTTTANNGSGSKAAGTFGNLKEPVCGPGDASGSTEQGVNDDSIKIGTLSDAGNTIIPGLLQEFFDAADAFVKWCNDAGGINGRKIELTKRDTKFLEGQQRMTEACAEDFLLVGGGTALDNVTTPVREGCKLPQITAFTPTPEGSAAKLQVNTRGAFPDYQDVSLHRLASARLGEAVKHYGVIAYAPLGNATPLTKRYPEALGQIGYTTVYTGEFPTPPATVDNYRPYIQSMKSAGVQIFETLTAPEQLVPVMSAFSDVGFQPKAVLGNSSLYSQTTIKGNDQLGKIPTYIEVNIYPFELAADNPPTQQFLDLMDKAIPGWSKNPKALAVESWASWLLFAKSATECGSNLTRDCVMDKAAKIGTWDGGGVTAPVTISTDGTPGGPQCVTVMRATPKGFEYDKELTKPTDRVFNCDEKNLVKVG